MFHLLLIDNARNDYPWCRNFHSLEPDIGVLCHYENFDRETPIRKFLVL